MSRFGCLMVLLFAVVIGAFLFVVRRGGWHGDGPVVAASQSSAAPDALTIPVTGVGSMQLVDTWGQSRGNGMREHHAIDIMAPRGTAVVAAAPGTVEKLFESREGGHTIYVRRPDRAWIDYYAHLDAYAPTLHEGEQVQRGQLLGTVGSTGDADPGAPHLHYEIKRMGPGETWWQGADVNPYPILAGKAGGS